MDAGDEHEGIENRPAVPFWAADADAAGGPTNRTPAPMSSAATEARRPHALVNICPVCGTYLGIYKVYCLSLSALWDVRAREPEPPRRPRTPERRCVWPIFEIA